MKDRRGFTLVEVLVVMTILALVMLIVFPSVSKLQKQNAGKKADAYRDVVIAAAKLYVQQKKDDLCGPNWDGYITISEADLINAKLLDEEAKDDPGCKNVKVSVHRTYGNYEYAVSMSCDYDKTYVVDWDTTQGCSTHGLESYFAMALCGGSQTCDFNTKSATLWLGGKQVSFVKYAGKTITVLLPWNLVSVPYYNISNGTAQKTLLNNLKEQLKNIYPELADKDLEIQIVSYDSKMASGGLKSLYGDNAYFALTNSYYYFGDSPRTFDGTASSSVIPVRLLLSIPMERAVSGSGKEGDLFVLSTPTTVKAGQNLNEVPVGRYIRFADGIYQIIGKDGSDVKVISMTSSSETFSFKYSSINASTDYTVDPNADKEEADRVDLSGDLLYWLNLVWYSSFDESAQKYIVPKQYTINIMTSNNPYTTTTKKKLNQPCYAWLPEVGDLFVTTKNVDDTPYWTATTTGTSSSSAMHYIGYLKQDSKVYQSPYGLQTDTTLAVRPVMYLDGTKITIQTEGTGIDVSAPLELALQ